MGLLRRAACATLTAGLSVSAAIAGDLTAEDVVREVSRSYTAMRPAVQMKAQVWKKGPERDGYIHEAVRDYRLIIVGDDVRVDVGNPYGLAIFRLLRRGNVVLYTGYSNFYTEELASDPVTENTREIVREKLMTLHGRFADLAAAKPDFRSIRPAQLRAGGVIKNCLRIGLKSPASASRKWIGDIWVERDTWYVWRATMTVMESYHRQTEEDVRWREIVTGPAVPLVDLDWKPPANARRKLAWTDRLPR